jgi:hypothetical protein
MKTSHSVVATCVFLLLIIVSDVGGQSSQPSMKSVMSQPEYAASGIGTLRPEQQLVIDRWLSRWTAAAASLSCGGNYPFTGQKHSIESNADGTILILDDDSIWLVQSIDRVDSDLWLPVSDVVVTKGRGGIAGFDYLIRSIEDKETVHAKYLGND